MPRGRRLIPLILALGLLAAACGGDAPSGAAPESPSPGGGFPVTVASGERTVTIAARPERIVSMSPTATEMLFGVGAGGQVVAVDSNSNHPAEAPTTDLAAFEPNVEAIASYDPDVVVISDDIGGLVDALDALEIPVVHQPAAASLEDTYSQIEDLGAATGHPVEASSLVASMREEIEALAGGVAPPPEPPTYYHELDDTYFSVTSDTFIGQLYALAGLENVADAAQDASGGYPQLSAEFIVDADPDLIFLADTKCCGQSAETLAARPGWDTIAAVENGAVVELDDDVASRWGPRVVDLLRVVVEAVRELEAA